MSQQRLTHSTILSAGVHGNPVQIIHGIGERNFSVADKSADLIRVIGAAKKVVILLRGLRQINIQKFKCTQPLIFREQGNFVEQFQ